MTKYRVFVLSRDGSIVSGHEIDCTDDAQACAAALGLLHAGENAAVWDQARRVGTVSIPRPPSRPPRSCMEPCVGTC